MMLLPSFPSLASCLIDNIATLELGAKEISTGDGSGRDLPAAGSPPAPNNRTIQSHVSPTAPKRTRLLCNPMAWSCDISTRQQLVCRTKNGHHPGFRDTVALSYARKYWASTCNQRHRNVPTILRGRIAVGACSPGGCNTRAAFLKRSAIEQNLK
ncbi:hypothetical protein CC86DRAFT_81867 [Ophiobolus disseminans]|uniref:Uncharacterized protein n=1 Tax=Ophiobolus disseminans TaxID=1469910 RepID=A0A6A6ZQK4_9PLEO|nr:hypothetical protein CC86DRAFT_81867 [Ophiobolus disseminans]